MLINKLKTYPKQSQQGGYGAAGSGNPGSGPPPDQNPPAGGVNDEGYNGNFVDSNGATHAGAWHRHVDGTYAKGFAADHFRNDELNPQYALFEAPAPPPNPVQENLYTSGGEYQLPNGTEYIGSYHVHPSQGPMVGATHTTTMHDILIPITASNTGNIGNATNTAPISTTMAPGNYMPVGPINITTPTVTTPTVYTPTATDLLEYEKYIVSGSTYKSNISQVNTRDQKGNIQLNESASNSLLIFEPVSNNFTNRSIVSSIDTQFQFFKFPAQISTTVQDLEFDESLLDIDVQQGILSDPYQGKLIRNSSNLDGGLYFVQGTEKRRFNIKAGSIWALKNNLPPFENIAGDIPGLDDGENNYGTFENDTFYGYHDVTYKIVPAGVYDGYTTGLPYGPEDAFAEGNVYGKAQIKLISDYATSDNFPAGYTSFIQLRGPSFGRVEWTNITDTTFDSVRMTEFDVSEMSNSFIGIKSNFPSATGVTQRFDTAADAPAWRAALQTNFGFDVRVGTSYLDFVQNAFREWALGSDVWNIQSVSYDSADYDNNSAKGTKPDDYLNDIKSTTPGQNQIDWGDVPGNMYKAARYNETTSLNNTPWYKLTLPYTEVTYKLILRQGSTSTNITGKLRDSNNETWEDVCAGIGLNPFKGAPFTDFTAGPGQYDGRILNINDIFPNGINGNQTIFFDIDVNPGATSGNFYIWFIGLNYDSTGNSNTDPGTHVVVPNSITVKNPAVGAGDNQIGKKNRLKNTIWGSANRSGGPKLEWDNSTAIHTGDTAVDFDPSAYD